MTRVFGLVDPDPERRCRVIEAVAQRFNSALELRNNRWEAGSLVILSQVGATTPVDQAIDGADSAWVLGSVYSGDGRSAASHVLKRLAAKGPAGINGLNGYYLACTVDASGAVTLGTDALGFFPLYFWANSDMLVFASDPGLVRLHPLCPARFSLEGLVGILLQGHEANGQSVWQNVTRPESGRVLHWRSGAGATTKAAGELIPDERHFGLAYESARQLINGTLHDAVSRATSGRGGHVGMMLSGGMDSRLVAGHLARMAPNHTIFAFGDATDMEVVTAAKVASKLRFPFVRVPILFEPYAAMASERVAEEQLSNSLWDFGWLSGLDTVRAYGLPVLSGFHGDPIMGGSAIDWAFDAQRGGYSFDAMFTKVNAWGMKTDDIEALIDAEGIRRVIGDVVDRMRARYDALPGLPFQKSWLWELYNRGRYHVTPYAWRLSDAAWPLRPYLDRQMLEVAAGMPLNHIARRRMQFDTLIRDFPALARLPLDRNSYDNSPVLSTLRSRITRKLVKPLAAIRTRGGERRAYYRLFNINNAGWRAVRELAEGSRAQAHGILRPDMLARWLPSPEQDIVVVDGIRDASSRKTLLAVMIFAGQEMEVTFANPDH